MFDKLVESVVKKSIKNERYVFSGLIISMCNKLNIPIDSKVFNTIKYNGRNVLDGAILSGNYDAVRLYLKNGAKLNLDVKDTVSYLNIAIAEKNVKMLEVLMEHIHDRSFLGNTDYDKKLISLINANDVTKKSPLETAVDLYVKSNDENEKESLKKCMKIIYNNPLFNKNNAEFYNKLWKEKANFFIGYDERIQNSIEDYILSTKNEELIKFFIDNGLRYVDESILCVNPKLYSHSAMILKFNKPIRLKDSNHDIAGILYSFEGKNKVDNTKRTSLDRVSHSVSAVLSTVSPFDGYMKRVMLTSEDISNIKKNKDNKLYKRSNISGRDVVDALDKTYETLEKIKKTESFQNYRLIKLLRELTTDIENIAYMFSLYSKDAQNFIEKDRIQKCTFINEIPILEVDDNKEEGYSIYDFIWKKPKELKLSHKEKFLAIEEFINVECLKVLKENKIIEKDSIHYDIEDIYALSSKKANDLHEKYCYPKTHSIDLSIKEKDSSTRKDYEVAMCGYKLMNILEKYNIDVEKYSFLKNNCITTLKKALSECGYKNYLKDADEELNICQKRHPLSVLERLKEMDTNSKKMVKMS